MTTETNNVIAILKANNCHYGAIILTKYREAHNVWFETFEKDALDRVKSAIDSAGMGWEDEQAAAYVRLNDAVKALFADDEPREPEATSEPQMPAYEALRGIDRSAVQLAVDRAEAMHWVVVDMKDVPVGSQCPCLGYFPTEDAASRFIATLPEYETGRYGLDPMGESE